MLATNNKPQCLIRNPTFEEFIFCKEITYKQADAVSVAEILTQNTDYNVSILIEKPFMKKGKHLWRVAVNGEMIPIGMYLLVFEDEVHFVDEENLIARYLDTGISDIGTSGTEMPEKGAEELEDNTSKKSTKQEGIVNEIENKIDNEENVYEGGREDIGAMAPYSCTTGEAHEEERAGAGPARLPGGTPQSHGLEGGANLVSMLAGMLAGAGSVGGLSSPPEQDPRS